MTIIDNRKVNDLTTEKQNRVYTMLKRKGYNATEFEHLFQGYIVNLPNDIKAKIGVDSKAIISEFKKWR